MNLNDAVNHIKTARVLNLSPEDRLVTLPAAIVGFSVTEKGGGKDGTNSLINFQAFLAKLVSGDFQGTFSPLCAQYDSQVQADGTIFAYKLLEHTASGQITRTMRWQNMLTLVDQLKRGATTKFWSTVAGDQDHIYSIVPKVIRQYTNENGLAKMLLLIDRHFTELQQISNEGQLGITITHLERVEQETDRILTECFGENWHQLMKSQIDQLIYQLERTEDQETYKNSATLQLARIAMNNAYPGMLRFAGQHRLTAALFEAKAANLDDHLANLTPEELAEWSQHRRFENNSEAKNFLSLIKEKLINQGEIGPAADALHEVVLYFTMGMYAAENNLLVIGLDIDHDNWMTLAWEYGYQFFTKNFKSRPPILYARNPDTGKADKKHAKSTYREVYYASRQYNDKPFQPLSSIPLREYFAL